MVSPIGRRSYSSTAWRRAQHRGVKYLPFVSDAFDVILYDYLGQGKSDAPDVPYSIGQFADALDAILEVNKVDKAWLVGASYGGFVALEMMRLHPDKVRGLFLSGVLLERARLFEMYLDLSLRWYRELPFEVYPDYLYEKMFSEKYVRAHEDAVEAAKHHIAGIQGQGLSAGASHGGPAGLADAALDEHRSEYTGKSIPAFVLAGAQDRLIPPWFQEAAASALGARFETVPECGHPVYLEQTDLFFGRLRTFASAQSPKQYEFLTSLLRLPGCREQAEDDRDVHARVEQDRAPRRIHLLHEAAPGERERRRHRDGGPSRHSCGDGFLSRKCDRTNSAPTIASGRANPNAHWGFPRLQTSTVYAAASTRSTIPTMSGFFHATRQDAARTIDGMECMKNPPSLARSVPSISKTSNENIVRNRMNRIMRPLGIQINLNRPRACSIASTSLLVPHETPQQKGSIRPFVRAPATCAIRTMCQSGRCL